MNQDQWLKDQFAQAKGPSPDKKAMEAIMKAAEMKVRGETSRVTHAEPSPSSLGNGNIVLFAVAAVALFAVLFMNHLAKQKPVTPEGQGTQAGLAAEEAVGRTTGYAFGDGELILFEEGILTTYKLGDSLGDFTDFEFADLTNYDLEDVWPGYLILKRDHKFYKVSSSLRIQAIRNPDKELLSPAGLEHRRGPLLGHGLLTNTELQMVKFHGESIVDVFSFLGDVVGPEFKFHCDDDELHDLDVTINLNKGIAVSDFLKIICQLTEPKLVYLPNKYLAGKEAGMQEMWITTKNGTMNPEVTYRYYCGTLMESLIDKGGTRKEFHAVLSKILPALKYKVEWSRSGNLTVRCRRDDRPALFSELWQPIMRDKDTRKTKDQIIRSDLNSNNVSKRYNKVMAVLKEVKLGKIAFNDEPVYTILAFMTDVTGVNFVPTEAVNDEEFQVKSLALKGGMTAYNFLRILSKLKDIRFWHKDGVIIVGNDVESLFSGKLAVKRCFLEQGNSNAKKIDLCIQALRKDEHVAKFLDRQKDSSSLFLPMGGHTLFVHPDVPVDLIDRIGEILEANSVLNGVEFDKWIKDTEYFIRRIL